MQTNGLGAGGVSAAALAAGLATATVTPTGASTARTLAARGADILSVLDFGADPTGVADSGAAFRAAVAASTAVYVPPGTYLINTTVTIPASNRLFGAGKASRLLPGMTDGTAVLQVAGGSAYWEIADFYIASSINSANFLAGTVNGTNCIGVKTGSSGVSFANRFVLRNIHCFGLKTAFDIAGFIPKEPASLFAEYCETGFIGNNINSGLWHINFENCRKSFALTTCSGTDFQLQDEGANVSTSGLAASTIDGCSSLAFVGSRWETSVNRGVSFLTIGATTICYGITFTAARFSKTGPTDFGIFPLSVDQCVGLSISGVVSPGSPGRFLKTTANTKGLVVRVTNDGTTQWQEDDSGRLRRHWNYFPNPHFDAWFRGWTGFSVTRGTASQETTKVRTGFNALKITCTISQSQTHADFTLGPLLAAQLSGKKMTVGCWVYLATAADLSQGAGPFDESLASGSRMLPDLSLASSGGSGGTNSATVNTYSKQGCWHFMYASATMQTTPTQVTVQILPNHSGFVAAGNEYMVVDSIYLIEGDDPAPMVNGELADSPWIPAKFTMGKMEYYADAQPADTQQTYAVGDKWWKTNVAAAGSPGSIVTTAGVGGTAVWKAMGALAA